MTDQKTPTSGSAHLGAGSRISGELYFPGTVELPGYVKGRVEASTIVIEAAGEVEGELHSASIIIKGRVNGQVFAGTVTLHASARVTGEIIYERLSIEIGAQFEGVCKSRHYQDPPLVDQTSGSAVV